MRCWTARRCAVFVGIDLGRERVPDATTLLKFRRRLEDNKLGEALFAKPGEVLQASGLKVGTGLIVDATIIAASSSTKNAQGERDPEMHQTKKGQQQHFGMKLHIGVDSKTGLAHGCRPGQRPGCGSEQLRVGHAAPGRRAETVTGRCGRQLVGRQGGAVPGRVATRRLCGRRRGQFHRLPDRRQQF